jgi:uncharacterized protein YodC (DUF2158 family)
MHKMNENELKIGDVVKSNEIPVPMTVTKITEKGAECTWFDGEDFRSEIIKNSDLMLNKPRTLH